MNLPLTLIAESLTEFCICYFKNSQHDQNAPPHHHIIIPINDDLSLLLCFITSQVEKKVWYYRKTNEDAISSLVRVDQSNLPFLKTESVIDCNQPIFIRKNDFSKIVDPKHVCTIKTRDVPEEVKEQILSAINNSPIVKPFIKKLLIPYPNKIT